MSDLISRCELFNRLATIPAPAEANEFKAKIYAVIQGMDATTETVERREMHKLIIRLKSGYEIPITCEDFTFKENRLSGELADYEIKGIKDNVPLYFRLTDVDCVVENLYGTADRPQGEWIVDILNYESICSVCGAKETDFIYGTEMWYGLGDSKFCPSCGARMKGARMKGADDEAD